jgi:hypothetical protein
VCHTGGVRVWLPVGLLAAAGLAVAAASALLLPVNRAVGADLCYGDACTIRDRMTDAAPQMYTSGVFVGLFCAYLVGALVIARDRESGWPETVLAGFALGVVQAGVAVPYAAARLHADAVPTMLGSPSVWRMIAVSFLAYPLWALLGLGIGRIVRSRVLLLWASLVPPLLLAWFGVCMGKDGPFLVIAIPMYTVILLADDQAGPYAAAVLLCALGGIAALANLAAGRSAARYSGVMRRTGT